MPHRLPPLRALEAFVVVAETRSLAKAAQELSLTKSAISRRIQLLESDLGVRLLRRSSVGVELTADGEAYHKLTGPAFDALHSAGTLLERPRRKNTLRIVLPQSFASHWLMPRLHGFYEKHPEIDLQLDSLGYFRMFEGDDVDIVLWVGREPLASFHCEMFLPIVQYPVCGPAVLERAPARTVDDLAAHTLLHLSTMPTVWAEWLGVAGAPGLTSARRQDFDTMTLAMEGAANGLGFAMAADVLCRRDIEKGRLIAPFSARLEGVRSMYFVCRKQDVSARLVRRFRAWLMSEALR
jgi:LysR family glycine cleavage system transcriptional activator